MKQEATRAERKVHGAWIDVAIILTGSVPPDHLLTNQQHLSDWLHALRGESAMYKTLGIYAWQTEAVNYNLVRALVFFLLQLASFIYSASAKGSQLPKRRVGPSCIR